jgi:5S rRNA maturation endonuclease (ribonuclease M5)
MNVTPERRFSPSRPCPVCGGHPNLRRGNGERCYGFLSDDGVWAHCTRAEHAGGLEQNPDSGTYAHKSKGDCRCGVRHDVGLADANGHAPRPQSKIVATYDYRSAEGNVEFHVVRFDPKDIRQRRPDGEGEYTWNLNGVERVLYRLPELLAANHGAVIFLPEGEKDADRLARLGLVATTNPGGARKWRDEYTATLMGRHVAILLDNDEEGRKHAENVARALYSRAASVKVVALPDLREKGDVSDWLDAGNTLEDLLKLVDATPEWEPLMPTDYFEEQSGGSSMSSVFTAADLMALDLPPVNYTVKGLLPEGVTLLASKPKVGKTWLAIGLGIAVATGGKALGTNEVEPGDVLYLALEDNRRRLRKRLALLHSGATAMDRLHLALEWPRLDEGGVERLEAFLVEHPETRLVVIDTLKKVRPRVSSSRSVYEVDYEVLEPLIPLAATYGVAILVIHHTRKADAEDPLDTISGSTGLTGGVDGAMVLKRQRGRADAFVYVTGRDIEEEIELALRWKAESAGWAIIGDAEEYRLSKERAEVMGVLDETGEAMTPTEVADALGENVNAVKMRM